MKFSFTARQLRETEDTTLFLLTNGLGGYCSVTGSFSAPRCDQGLLVAAVKAPNVRINLVHRLGEQLILPELTAELSSQGFADGTKTDGLRYLRQFTWDGLPQWDYLVEGVKLQRRCCMRQGENTVAILYTVENTTDKPCTLAVTPWLKFAPKEEALKEKKAFVWEEGAVTAGDYTLHIRSNGQLQKLQPCWQTLAYPEDVKDGRPASGMAGSCCRICWDIAPGKTEQLELVFSDRPQRCSGWELLSQARHYADQLEQSVPFADPVARELARAADAYIARRDSTGGKTILAGYPLFSDWGRDTMIALPGCCMATGRYEDAKSILRTFLAYERDGLVPNLFPEGAQAPMYNTVDAALLLIDSVWQYVQQTQDWAFAWEAWDTMNRIITGYRKGTHHGIGMDEDGLIFAGKGLDQVTWMDVCVDGVLPTPRHGKPVEINAYWYNALRIMDALAEILNCDEKDYAELAEQVKQSFIEKFYIPEKGYLRDVISGTDADTQIRCNQIWALSMSYSMLSKSQEKTVLETVQKHLYTPYGLRTLSPEDPQYHPHYGGPQFDRDMAYHQGTAWVFPMGAYYRAYLKVYGNTPETVAAVKAGLANIETMLRQGCIGQLPEIYDGSDPCEGKGCFAQAWSVGEILRVYDAIEKLQEESK